MDNINSSNDINEKIFLKLKDWQKEINISLELPNSSYNSIFKNTTFVGDEILNSSDGNKKINSKNVKSNKNKSNDDNDDLEGLGISQLEDFEDINNLKEEFVINNILFNPSDEFTYSTKKVLIKHTNSNLTFILYLIGLYSYSYMVLVPNIIMIFFNENNNDKIYLYSITISIPIFGNMIAKYFYERYISTSYYCILIISIIFLLFYYIFVIISFFIDINKENNFLIKIIFIIIGRFLLGLSYLKQIGKYYIDIYVPLSNKVQINAKYNSSIYYGYIFGLLINCIFYFKLNNSYLNFGYIIISSSYVISSIIIIIIFKNFEKPKLFK